MKLELLTLLVVNDFFKFSLQDWNFIVTQILRN